MNDDVVVLALGSNLRGEFSSVQDLLEAALADFPAAGLAVAKRSSWWRSASWPDASQPDYLNGVILVETRLDPHDDVMPALRGIEARFGRRRDARTRRAPSTST